MINNDINDTYPNHAEALRIAGLNPKQFPTFKETSMKLNKTNNKKKKRRKRKTKNLDQLIFALESAKPGCMETLFLTQSLFMLF